MTDRERDRASLEAAVDEAPPGVERPVRRALLARVAIDVRPLRESPAFRRLWIGQATSFFGSGVTFVAIPFQMYELTARLLLSGWWRSASSFPCSRSRSWAGPSPMRWIAAASCSLRSLTPRLVPQEQFAAASALQSLYGNLAAVGGPAMGGALIAALGLTTTYLIDAGSFAASLIAIALLPPAPPGEGAEPAGVRSLLEGLRFVRRSPVIMGILLLDTNAMIFGMPSALFPALASERFDAGAGVVGLLYAAPYAGALAATLLSGWIGRVRRQGLGVAVAASLWGLALVAFGFATALWLALLMLALAGAADMVSATWRSTIVLTATPEPMLGRVTGIELAQVASAPTLGNVEAGVLASLTSVRFSIVSGGLACVAGCALIVAAIPALPRYDGRTEPRSR